MVKWRIFWPLCFLFFAFFLPLPFWDLSPLNTGQEDLGLWGEGWACPWHPLFLLLCGCWGCWREIMYFSAMGTLVSHHAWAAHASLEHVTLLIQNLGLPVLFSLKQGVSHSMGTVNWGGWSKIKNFYQIWKIIAWNHFFSFPWAGQSSQEKRAAFDF